MGVLQNRLACDPSVNASVPPVWIALQGSQGLVQVWSIDAQALHVGTGISRAMSCNGENCSAAQVKLSGSEERTAQCEARDARDLRIQTERGEDVPGRHGSAIIIARQTARAGIEELRLGTSDNALGTIRSAREIVNPGHTKFWLVPYKGVEAGPTIVQFLKMLVQTHHRRCIPTHVSQQTRQILRHHPGIRCAGRFYEAIITLRNKIAEVCAIGVARHNIARVFVKKIAPVPRTFEITSAPLSADPTRSQTEQWHNHLPRIPG